MKTGTKNWIVGPTPCLNGSTKGMLFESYVGAVVPLLEAREALNKLWPHGRDYQISPKGHYQMAVEQHKDRLERIDKILLELRVICHLIETYGEEGAPVMAAIED